MLPCLDEMCNALLAAAALRLSAPCDTTMHAYPLTTRPLITVGPSSILIDQRLLTSVHQLSSLCLQLRASGPPRHVCTKAYDHETELPPPTTRVRPAVPCS